MNGTSSERFGKWSASPGTRGEMAVFVAIALLIAGAVVPVGPAIPSTGLGAIPAPCGVVGSGAEGSGIVGPVERVPVDTVPTSSIVFGGTPADAGPLRVERSAAADARPDDRGRRPDGATSVAIAHPKPGDLLLASLDTRVTTVSRITLTRAERGGPVAATAVPVARRSTCARGDQVASIGPAAAPLIATMFRR